MLSPPYAFAQSNSYKARGLDGPTKTRVSLMRRWRGRGWWTLCVMALILLVAPVLVILVNVVSKAVAHWNFNVLWTTSAGNGHGLANAIVGTLVLMLGVGIIAGLVGVGAGVYIAEFARPSLSRTLLRGASEVLSGVPSIVFGYVGYLALVVGLHWGYSLLPALLVVSFLVVPYIAKATELSLGQVPLSYREGATALGMTKSQALKKITLKAALPGISTGVIFALAISAGETAPLLYTAGWTGAYPSLTFVHQPIGYLTYATWTFYDEPSSSIQQLANDAALLIVLLVLLLILLSRFVSWWSARHSPERAN